MMRTGLGVSDDRPVADRVARIRPPRARRLVEIALSEAASTDLDLISLRATAEMVRAAGGLAEVLGSAQESLVSCGAGGLGALFADDVGPAVALNQPVTSIVRDEEGVTVRTPYEAIRARRVIVAVAPPGARKITHQPALPDSRALVQRETFMGTVYKAVIVYDEPFWRDAGLSGEASSLDGLVPTVVDVSPTNGPGHLCALVPGS